MSTTLQPSKPFQTLNQTVSPLLVTIDKHYLEVKNSKGLLLLALRLDLQQNCIAHRQSSAQYSSIDPLLAAFEAIITQYPTINHIELVLNEWKEVSLELLVKGIAIRQENALLVDPAMLWQLPHLWLPEHSYPVYPQIHHRTEHHWHPIRAPKPTDYVYERFIPWLGQTIAFRAAQPERDLKQLHQWMNDPHIAEFFQEEGDLSYHAKYLNDRIEDPHMIPLIGEFNHIPFGYFEIYWAKENRISPYYDAHDYDRGWHVLVGEAAYRGRQWISAWLPSLMHYLFLADPRTQRIVGEPQADHHQQIRNLEKSGFARLKEFDFPHKKAALVMLLREHYFSKKLWTPAI
ncbi:MAG: GNAT family N-acetyltransferase [Pseudomonadota bacterium]